MSTRIQSSLAHKIPVWVDVRPILQALDDLGGKKEIVLHIHIVYVRKSIPFVG